MEHHSVTYYRIRTTIRGFVGLTGIFVGFVLPHIVIARVMEHVGV